MKNVVQYNNQTDLYLTVYDPEYSQCQWGSLEAALSFPTLKAAQDMAKGIGHGTVGTVK